MYLQLRGTPVLTLPYLARNLTAHVCASQSPSRFSVLTFHSHINSNGEPSTISLTLLSHAFAFSPISSPLITIWPSKWNPELSPLLHALPAAIPRASPLHPTRTTDRVAPGGSTVSSIH